MDWTLLPKLLGITVVTGVLVVLLSQVVIVRTVRKAFRPLREDLDQLAVQLDVTRHRMDRTLGRAASETEDGERS